MTDSKLNKLCDTFEAYWRENNNNGDWPKHGTTLTGSWKGLAEDDPDPAWSDKEATLRINGLRKLTAQAARYNAAMAAA